MSPGSQSWPIAEVGIGPGYALTGSGVTVALIDSGVDTTHPALAGRIVAAYECGSGRLVPIDHTVDHDLVGHGTRMAGLICADRAHGGIAPGARIISIVYPQHATSHARIYTALLALGHAVKAGFVVAQIVNVSSGLIPKDAFHRQLIQNQVLDLLQAGVLVVAAVGNEQPLARMPVDCPADLVETLGVGASNRNHRVCDTSRSGPDLVAPGEQILSCEQGGTFSIRPGGTSQATAIASGVAALYLEQARTPPDVLRKRIYANCVPLVGEPSQRQGRGLIQAP